MPETLLAEDRQRCGDESPTPYSRALRATTSRKRGASAIGPGFSLFERERRSHAG